MCRLLSHQAVIVYLDYMHMTIIYLINEKHSYSVCDCWICFNLSLRCALKKIYRFAHESPILSTMTCKHIHVYSAGQM